MAQESTSVDLGQSFGKEPTIPGATEGSDTVDASSQSPLSQSRGGADPENIATGSPGSQDFDAISASGKVTSDEGGSGDPANDHAWSRQGDRYTPRY